MSEANITDILITIAGTMVLSFAALFWWILKTAWDMNEKEHDQLRLGLKDVAKETRRVSGRVDHIIRYHEGIPKYKDDE